MNRRDAGKLIGVGTVMLTTSSLGAAPSIYDPPPDSWLRIAWGQMCWDGKKIHYARNDWSSLEGIPWITRPRTVTHQKWDGIPFYYLQDWVPNVSMECVAVTLDWAEAAEYLHLGKVPRHPNLWRRQVQRVVDPADPLGRGGAIFLNTDPRWY